MVKKIKYILFLFYVVNLTYFSFASFLSETLSEKNLLFYQKYNSFLGKTGLYKIYSFFKLNVAYAFFGNGLYAGTYIEFTYFDENQKEIVTTDFTEAFSTTNARLRAGNISTILSFNSIYRIRSLKDRLSGLDQSNDSTRKTILDKKIKYEEEIFDECLYSMGNYAGGSIQNWSCFSAKYYYLIPNDLSSLDRRKLFLYRKVLFQKNAKKI